MKQVYLDLVDGYHIKVTPLAWEMVKLLTTEYPVVRVRVDETRFGFKKGEELTRRAMDLFCIDGYSDYGKIRAVAPELLHLERIAS